MSDAESGKYKFVWPWSSLPMYHSREFIKVATLCRWGTKTSEKYRVFLTFSSKSSISSSKSNNFHIWHPFGRPFYQLCFPRSKKTLKMLEFLILFWGAPSLCSESPHQKWVFRLHGRRLFSKHYVSLARDESFRSWEIRVSPCRRPVHTNRKLACPKSGLWDIAYEFEMCV